jgi:hypothetical protein
MDEVVNPSISIRDRFHRRELLRIGGLGLLGQRGNLGLIQRAEAATSTGSALASRRTSEDSSFGRAKSCIILFLMGGPPQHSTWDPKPDAPAEIRGEFAPIGTNVPGLSISELLPGVARVAEKICILRAMSTGDHAHSSSGYYMLTGRPHQPTNVENVRPGPPNDFPSLATLMGVGKGPRTGSPFPPSIAIPDRLANCGNLVWPGQDAGFLGRAKDPWLLNGRLTSDGYRIREIELPDDLDPERLGRRKDLLDRVRRDLDAIERDPQTRPLDEHSKRAFDLLHSPRARRAFRLDLEPENVRERYGKHLFGQSVLMARRLVEAGVRVVQVNWQRGQNEPPGSPVWDTHRDEARGLKDRLASPFDRAFSALLEDLDRRGLLEETAVVCTGEFGRDPRINAEAGRGHWGTVFSAVLAGGGIRGGLAYGASDRIGARPADGLVRPEDLTATLLHCLGVDPSTEIRDSLTRPFPMSRGEVLHAIL